MTLIVTIRSLIFVHVSRGTYVLNFNSLQLSLPELGIGTAQMDELTDSHGAMLTASPLLSLRGKLTAATLTDAVLLNVFHHLYVTACEMVKCDTLRLFASTNLSVHCVYPRLDLLGRPAEYNT